MWIQAIAGLSPGIEFGPPAPPDALTECERVLGHPLPAALRDLLAEANGMTHEYCDLLWPIERIQADNVEFRTYAPFAELYMPFDPLLFFSDAGNGDQFALILRGMRPDVFAWNHEDDSRTCTAPDLLTFFTWWFEGKITT